MPTFTTVCCVVLHVWASFYLTGNRYSRTEYTCHHHHRSQRKTCQRYRSTCSGCSGCCRLFRCYVSDQSAEEFVCLEKPDREMMTLCPSDESTKPAACNECYRGLLELRVNYREH